MAEGSLRTSRVAGLPLAEWSARTQSNKVQWQQTLVHPDNRQGITRLIHKPSKQAQPCLYIILLDTSGSMLARQGLSNAKGILQYFCNNLYLQRDLLTLISFGNQQVDVLHSAKPAPKSFDSILRNIRGGGGTPLGEALDKVAKLSKQYSNYTQALYVLTDGRTKETFKLPRLLMPVTLIDMDNNAIRLHNVKNLAMQLKGTYLHIDQLQRL